MRRPPFARVLVLVAGCSSAVTPAANVAPDAGPCSLNGTWNLDPPAYPPHVIRFNVGGTWEVASNAAGLGVADVTGGTYTLLAGGQVSLVEDLVALSPTGCAASEVGRYAFTFGAACDTLMLTVVSDPCMTRVGMINGVTLTR